MNKFSGRPADRLRASSGGFSLIELAIVIVIGSILLTSLSSMLLIYVKQNQIRVTQSRLDQIDAAIQIYLGLNGSLPCPAPMNADVNTADFGLRGSNTACEGGGTGLLNPMGSGGRQVVIGAVPVRSLNLPDDFAFDAWSNRITYAVTGLLADGGQYDGRGAISLVDANGNSIITPADQGEYAVVSHGPDGVGASSFNGVAGTACDTTTKDGENCDGDATFLRTLLTATGATTNHYDDMLKFRATSSFDVAIPSKAVWAFDLPACPPGWVPFNKGFGRVVVGAQAPDFAYNTTGGNASWPENLTDLNLAVNAPTASAAAGTAIQYVSQPTAATPFPANNNLPPYVALTLCMKP